jgi:threonine/homoserine/homoserine lactone efflux protein
MSELLAVTGVLAALAVGVVSPGPSFILVARIAVASSRGRGLAAALGMGVGGALFAAMALLGLQAVFHAVPVLYLGLKVIGGAYLIYLGATIFRHARTPLSMAEACGGGAGASRSFWLGLSTQVSNPKTAIVYASVFAAFLPQQFSLGFAALLLLCVFALETGWYALVALVLSARPLQRAYLSWKTWLDRAAGIVMGALGARLVLSAWRAPQVSAG